MFSWLFCCSSQSEEQRTGINEIVPDGSPVAEPFLECDIDNDQDKFSLAKDSNPPSASDPFIDIAKKDCPESLVKAEPSNFAERAEHGQEIAAVKDAAEIEQKSLSTTTFFEEALKAAAAGEILRAQSLLLEAEKQGEAIPKDPILEQLPSRIKRLEKIVESCREPTASNWRKFELGDVTMWRCWDTESGSLKVIFRWEVLGSLQRQIIAMREPEGGQKYFTSTWETVSHHANGASLNRWLQKDLLTGQTQEIIVERVFCDCLDNISPCWVILERSPDTNNFETFSGQWGPFDIPSVPNGIKRQVLGEGGRVIQPISPDRTATSMALTIEIPWAVRWMVTDSLLRLAASSIAEQKMKSWLDLNSNWSSCDYDQRMQTDEFYTKMNDRMEVFWASKSQN